MVFFLIRITANKLQGNMRKIIQFKNLYARRLLRGVGVDHTKLTEAYLDNITETIRLIREKNDGAFNESHILPLINFLDNHWKPSDICFALDPGYTSLSPNR